MSDEQLNKKFLSMLESTPDTTDFSNGEGYVLQDPEVIDEIQKYFLDRFGSYYVAGRTLDDSNSILYGAFLRAFAVDKKYREWGQTFYSLHPDEGTDFCYNPEFEKVLLKKNRKNKLDQIENH